jgi:hypothetical protein
MEKLLVLYNLMIYRNKLIVKKVHLIRYLDFMDVKIEEIAIEKIMKVNINIKKQYIRYIEILKD